MLSKLRNLPGLWRLCIVLCVPFTLAVAYCYVYEVPEEPPINFKVWVAHDDYPQTGRIQVGYARDWHSRQEYGSRKWFNEVGFTGASDVPGYRLVSGTGDWRYWLVASEKLPNDVVDRAREEMVRMHSEAANERTWDQLRKGAVWLSIAVAPFFIYWIVVLVACWVRAGFAADSRNSA